MSPQVAIKIIRKENVKTPKDMERVRREIDILSVLRHPHIIKVIDGKSHTPHIRPTYAGGVRTGKLQVRLREND